MGTITINGLVCEFEQGEKIIDVANRSGIEIPQYCYHKGLSVPAQCRICLAQISAPNPRNDGKLELMMGGKLLPTCSTEAAEGMVVTTESELAVANQKAVMEFLLINHPLDCPVCDQAGECTLQDFSYHYGRGHSRFTDQKVKQPKKDLGPNVYLYSDRCIMCTRCVRFADEVAGTTELMIDGRGNQSQIDVFPGVPLDNPLASNVIDLCPVGALLDKDFLFAQRVWFLKRTAGIDPLTASGDNIWVEHNEGKVYRLKPRENMDINTWWMTDEVRYGWKFVHSDDRLTGPVRRQHGLMVEATWTRAYKQAIEMMRGEGSVGVLISPMLTSEEAFALVTAVRSIDESAKFYVGAVPVDGEDRAFKNTGGARDFVMRAEKAPNARGVRRVLDSMNANGGEFGAFLKDAPVHGCVVLTGNYPSDWVTDELVSAISDTEMVLIDTLDSRLVEMAGVVLPSGTFAEKSGSFENCDGVVQHFGQAIPCQHESKSEGQIAMDLIELGSGGVLEQRPPAFGAQIVDAQPGQVSSATESVNLERGELFEVEVIRGEMGKIESLSGYVGSITTAPEDELVESDMEMVTL
ncbi:MAG: (2Fe-2S)-binding protein [Phycisphaerales bacterium]|nr:(2Fe-2S)-binding protein [Phycisphaerales bacterium]